MNQESSCFTRPRSVVKKVFADARQEAEGLLVRRIIGSNSTNKSFFPGMMHFDPFVMLAEFSAVSSVAAFADHPHRGFESVAIVLEGTFTYQDFYGRKVPVRAGDLQWMTTGRGIVHSESPTGDGVHTALQLWVNLSSEDKKIDPGYRYLPSGDIAQAEKDGVRVRIVAGEAFGVQIPTYTQTPMMYLDFTMRGAAQLHQSIPESWNAFVYIIEGEGVFGDSSFSSASSHHALYLSPGNGLSVWNRSGKPLRFILVGGQPLNEPVVQHGPFIMNTETEIEQAFKDYKSCENGFEKAKGWKSHQV